MAEEKKSVILYVDIMSTFEALTDQQAGRLIKHYLRYVNDLNPKAPDKITQIAFEPIKQQLKRDLVKWEGIKNKRREAGKASAEIRKQKSTNPTHVESVQQEPTNPTVNGNVNVNVNGNVINKERENTSHAQEKSKSETISLKTEEKYNSPGAEILYSIEHCISVALADERWVRKNKASPEILKLFNSELESQGIYEKNPDDYKRHFYHWSKKEKNGTHQSNSKRPPGEKLGTSAARINAVKNWGLSGGGSDG